MEFNLPTVGKRHFISRYPLSKSPSTNLSRKGNGVSDDSLDCITFSIAQGSTFLLSTPGDTSLRVGLWIQAVSRGQFQVCDDGAQYLLRLGQRVADSSLRWILRLQFCTIRLLSCEVSGYSCLNLQWERKRQVGCWTFMSYKIFVIKSKIKLTFLQIKCYFILFECFIKVYWELFSMPSFFSTFKMAFYCFTDLNAKTHHKCILLLHVCGSGISYIMRTKCPHKDGKILLIVGTFLGPHEETK